jgi:hypothetical protein
MLARHLEPRGLGISHNILRGIGGRAWQAESSQQIVL